MLACGILVIAAGSCKEQIAQEKPVRPIKTVAAKPFGRISDVYSGIVAPLQFSNLAFRISGPLVSVNVEEGQSVKQGDVIAKIDPLDYRIDFDAKQASFITAQSQMERAENLLAKEAISKQDYETVRASCENARAAYENSRNILEQTILRAPFSGFVYKKYAENYQEVLSGSKIVCLINPEQLQIQATLPDNALAYITQNPEVYVGFEPYTGKKFKARIKEYVQSSPDGSGIPVFVEITEPSFNPIEQNVAVGFSCTVELVVEDTSLKGAVLVPLSAIAVPDDSSAEYLFVYNPKTGTVSKRGVTVGRFAGKENVVVTSGLQSGELVVSAGVTRIADGMRVKLIEE